MTDLNIGKAADFRTKTSEILKKGVDSIKKFITESGEKTLAGKAAKFVGQVKENGLQETAEDIIDDIKDFTEETPSPSILAVSGFKIGRELGEKLKDSPFGAVKWGAETGDKIKETLKSLFSDK